jgi:hypothetical protein
MDKDARIANLIADLEACLIQTDSLGLSMAAIFICHAIEKVRAEVPGAVVQPTVSRAPIGKTNA